MKKQTPIPFLLLLSIFFAQCEYERIIDPPVNSACEDTSTPTSGNIIFNQLTLSSTLKCKAASLNEVVQFNDQSGLMAVGRCRDNADDTDAIIIIMGPNGSDTLCRHEFESESGTNFFTSMAEVSGRYVTTGFTRGNDFNAKIFNFKVGATSCREGDVYSIDNTDPTVIQKWDAGSSIIADAASDDVIVGGKMAGFPALFRLNDIDDMGTDGVDDFEIFDANFFSTNAQVELADVNVSSPTPGHTISKIIQTGDDGFLATGFVDAVENNVFVKKAFLIKTNPDFGGAIVKVYNEDELPFKNTMGWDLLEVGGGNIFAMVGVGFDGQNPQNLAEAGFPSQYPRDGFDGFILFAKNNDLSYSDHDIFMCNAKEDYATCMTYVTKGVKTDFLVAGVVSDKNSDAKKIRVKSYSNDGNLIKENNVDIEIGASDEIAFPADIINTGDGNYLIIANINDMSDNSKGVRFINFGL